MRPKHTRKYVTGIDIGSNTVYSIIAFEDENGQVNILGTGATDSRGVKQGIVID
ncbi:cell division protein FtsA, partial [PVC group bacterium]|nr:cell division protein FtsA [PVC group bacterium]